MDASKRSWFRRRRNESAPTTATDDPHEPATDSDDNPDDSRSAVDVCFVFDTTGSMSNKIVALVDCMVDFVGELSTLELNWRITTVPYGDLTVKGDKIVADLPFVRSHDEAVRQLRTMPRFRGGTNDGESTFEAVVAALDKPFRPNAVPVLVVLTDEPPLTGMTTAKQVARRLTAAEVICFVVAPDRRCYRRWAYDNGGEWYEIGRSMNTERLLGYLRSLVREVPQVARAVHDLGGGSVRRYLRQDDDLEDRKTAED
jgi:hypothetical protein